MQLTQKQQTLVLRHLREKALAQDASLPERQRQEALAREKTRIMDALEALGRAASDEEVLATLDGRIPGRDSKPVEAPMRRTAAAPARLQLDQEHAVWLGVCAGLAAHFDIERWMVRAVFVLCGAAAPIALALYAGLYMLMHLATPKDARRPFRIFRATWRAGAAIAVALLLHFGSRYAIDFFFYANERFLQEFWQARFLEGPTSDLGRWGWLEEKSGAMLFWAIVLSVPFAGLSGFAHVNGWDHTLKRVAQALLAIYGVLLAFGIASVLVGAILQVVVEFQDTAGGAAAALASQPPVN